MCVSVSIVSIENNPRQKVIITFDLDWVAIYLYSLADCIVAARLISMTFGIYHVHLSVSRGKWFHDDQWYISMLDKRSSTNLIHLALWVLLVDITNRPVLSPLYSLPTGSLYHMAWCCQLHTFYIWSRVMFYNLAKSWIRWTGSLKWPCRSETWLHIDVTIPAQFRSDGQIINIDIHTARSYDEMF